MASLSSSSRRMSSTLLVAGLLEELHRALADAADEEEPLALGERLDRATPRR